MGIVTRTHWRGRRAGAVIRWSSSEAGRDRTAFTLIEILLAVGLIGLLAAAMVTVATHVADGKPRTARDIFWEATRTARRTALQSETDVRLTYDAKEKAFLVDAGGNVKKFPVPETRELTIDLLQAQTSGGSILIGGQLVDTRTLASVSFYSDGTCTPFRIQFRTTGPARIESIDPWTCAPVLPDPKKT